jgi:hypothetical protein
MRVRKGKSIARCATSSKHTSPMSLGTERPRSRNAYRPDLVGVHQPLHQRDFRPRLPTATAVPAPAKFRQIREQLGLSPRDCQSEWTQTCSSRVRRPPLAATARHAALASEHLRPAQSRRHLYVTCYTEGFSHFVTSTSAPVLPAGACDPVESRRTDSSQSQPQSCQSRRRRVRRRYRLS